MKHKHKWRKGTGKLPNYINCKNKEIEVCDYYMTRNCKDTCAYCRDIGAVVKKEDNRIGSSGENISRFFGDYTNYGTEREEENNG